MKEGGGKEMEEDRGEKNPFFNCFRRHLKVVETQTEQKIQQLLKKNISAKANIC